MSVPSEPLEPRIQRALDQLRGPGERTVINAVHALADIGDPALPPLLGALIDKDARLRRGAACALGYLRNGTSVPALLTALTDDDTQVRELQSKKESPS